MKVHDFRIIGCYFLLSAFAAFASYRLHLEGFEVVIDEGLDAIINGSGRAPDQYRILPYLILSGIRALLSPWFGLDWKFSILVFESASLFGAVMVLNKFEPKLRDNYIFPVILLLVYPYLMFDGVRSIAAFILLISSVTVLLFNRSHPPASVKLSFYFTLVLFSFTRADIALLVGLICSVYMALSLWEKLLAAAIPVVIQLLLSNVFYPDAEYYSALIMVTDNLSLVYFINNPMTYFLLALTIFHAENIKKFVMHLYVHQKLVLVLVAGYFLTVFIIGRPNEYRLFLPLVPVCLLIMKKREETVDVHAKLAE